MKFQQIIFALNRIIQVLISLEYTLFNIIPKSLVTLQFLKFLIVQIKAYIQGFQMRYQSFLGHWYPNSYSWFSDSMDILFVLITTVRSNCSKKCLPVVFQYLWKGSPNQSKCQNGSDHFCMIETLSNPIKVRTTTNNFESFQPWKYTV